MAARLPFPDSPDECGMSRWNGEKPRFSSWCRAWGCTAYVKVHDPASKVHDQGVRCMYLGRAHGHSHGWRCLDVATGKIYVTPKVDFVETSFPGITVDSEGRERFVPGKNFPV